MKNSLNTRPFSLLIKPASFLCNLRCDYCFYLCKEEIFPQVRIMTPEILERMISSFMAIPMPQYSFGWQGGEPTLMGLNFFKLAVSFQKKYGKPGTHVANGLQTNGTLLDDDWCKFLAEYNFLVGLSIDGPPEIHNIHRKTEKGEGSHKLVIESMTRLKQYRVEFNALTLVSDANVKHAKLVYNYLKGLGINYHQYIECVEFDNSGQLLPFSVTGEEWGEFLCEIFDTWYKHDAFSVSVRLFDSILTLMIDGYPNVCVMNTDCRQYLVVEHNGDIYPCDFFVEPELKLGNIMRGEWRDFLNSPLYEEFGKRKRLWHEECNTCKYLPFCVGCCPKNRYTRSKKPHQRSVLCNGWKMFFEHTLSRFQVLAKKIKEKRRKLIEVQERQRQKDRLKIGRNDLCPCGSGKKYKKCCGR